MIMIITIIYIIFYVIFYQQLKITLRKSSAPLKKCTLSLKIQKVQVNIEKFPLVLLCIHHKKFIERAVI